MKVRIDNQILGVNGLTEAEVVYNHVRKLEKFVFVSKLWEVCRTQKDLYILIKIPNNCLQFVIAKSLQFGASQYKCSYLLEQIQLFTFFYFFFLFSFLGNDDVCIDKGACCVFDFKEYITTSWKVNSVKKTDHNESCMLILQLTEKKSFQLDNEIKENNRLTLLLNPGHILLEEVQKRQINKSNLKRKFAFLLPAKFPVYMIKGAFFIKSSIEEQINLLLLINWILPSST